MGIHGSDTRRFSTIPEEQMHNVNIVVGAYRSVRHPVAYVSMPITTGKLFYDVLDKYNVKNIEELAEKNKDVLYEEIILPNISAGIELADRIAEKISLPVLAPSVFEAKKQRWSQDDYMYMWFRVIEERVEEMYMMDGWEYSNGGTQEFVRAMEMQFGFINPNNGMEYFPDNSNLEQEHDRLRNVRVYDQQGKEILIHEGAVKIASAIKVLEKRGFDFGKRLEEGSLLNSYHKLLSIGGYYMDPLTPSRHKPPYTYSFRKMNEALSASS